MAGSLDALRGPVEGLIELPQRLFWSGAERVFDLSDFDRLLEMYEVVFDAARTETDLAEYINGETLGPRLARCRTGPARPPGVGGRAPGPAARHRRGLTPGMAFDDLHRHVARIALKAVGRKYEVALAGGNALMVHEVVSRHTEDVDLFVRRLGNVAAAASEIEAALQSAGYTTQRIDAAASGELGDFWPDMGEELAEWEVTAPDGEHTVQLQAAYFETLEDPVTVPGLGPVLALDDLAGWKTVALVSRMAARDYVDIAALLKRYTVGQLVGMARERDPGLEDADFADAALRLDQMRDSRLTPLLSGLGGEDVGWLRKQFARWPRDAARGKSRDRRPRVDTPIRKSLPCGRCPATVGSCISRSSQKCK